MHLNAWSVIRRTSQGEALFTERLAALYDLLKAYGQDGNG